MAGVTGWRIIFADIHLSLLQIVQHFSGWIIGGGGVVLSGIGLVVTASDVGEEIGGIFDSNTNDGGDSGPILVAAGLVAVGASVPLFLAAARNKKHAASLSFKHQFVPQFNNGSFVRKPIPSLSLKISTQTFAIKLDPGQKPGSHI